MVQMINIVILAAGIGSRLGKLTKEKPKGLVEINNEPLFDINLKTLDIIKNKRIRVITGHKSNLFNKYNVKKIKNKNFRFNGILDSFILGLNKIENFNDSLFLYSDIIYDEDVILNLLKTNHEFTIPILNDWKALWKKRFNNPLCDLETCKTNNIGQITEIGKKPKNFHDINGQFMGILHIKKNVSLN